MASSKRGVWFKFGRFITGLTIACFFLPFFGVSCDGLEVITVSGADMVGGCRPGGVLAEAADQKKSRGGGMDSDDMKGDIQIDKVPREPLAIAALGLALVVFGLSWVRSRGAMTGAAVLSVACLGVLIGLYLKVGGKMKDDVASQTNKKGGMSGSMMSEAKGKIDAGARFGLWAACLGLIASGALSGLALKEPEGTENMPRTPPPA